MSRTRNMKRGMMAAKARRDSAMERLELRGPSEPRVAPDGPMSFPSKVVDPDLREMIDQEVERLKNRGLL